MINSFISMAKFVNNLYKNQALFYKVFLFVLTSVLIVYLLPKGGKFKYEIPKGKPWQYENLYAPFDFAILKTEDELKAERQEIKDNHIPYYKVNAEIPNRVKATAIKGISNVFPDSTLRKQQPQITNFIQNTIDKIYERGLLQENSRLDPDQLIYLRKGNDAFEVAYKKVLKQGEVRKFLNDQIENSSLQAYKTELLEIFFDSIEPNVTFDNDLTQKELESKLNNISYTRGSIEQGSRVISKGEVVEGDKYNILRSLKAEYESQMWSKSNYNWILVGYSTLVAMALLMLLLFIRKYRLSI
ncbi:MAG: phosphohydrolase, partial [Salegentibacter sp.]